MPDLDLLRTQDRVLESDLRSPEKFVAIAILSHWSRRGRVFPSIARLANLTSLGKRTVIRAVASLEAAGAIRAIHMRGKPTQYDPTPLASLPVPERHRCQRDTSAGVAPDQCQSGTRLVPERHPNKPTKEPKKEPKKEPTNVEFALTGPEPEPVDPVVTVFEFWQRDAGHPDAKLDDKRRNRIKKRLKEGFTVEELQLAIVHRRNDPWLMGEVPGSKGFDSIHTLLRDAAQVERLRDLTERVAPRKTDGTRPVQHNGETIHEGCETYS